MGQYPLQHDGGERPDEHGVETGLLQCDFLSLFGDDGEQRHIAQQGMQPDQRGEIGRAHIGQRRQTDHQFRAWGQHLADPLRQIAGRVHACGGHAYLTHARGAQHGTVDGSVGVEGRQQQGRLKRMGSVEARRGRRCHISINLSAKARRYKSRLNLFPSAVGRFEAACRAVGRPLCVNRRRG